MNLTDGRLVQFGCVNTTSAQTGCILGQLDVGIRTASFRFAPGERVTQMALFAGPDDKGNPNRRAGAIRFATSMVLPAISLLSLLSSCLRMTARPASECKAYCHVISNESHEAAKISG